MIHKTFQVGAFQCNCHLLIDEVSKSVVVIDPGDEADLIQQEISKIERQIGLEAKGEKLTIKTLLHTHGHLDHIGATKQLFESSSAFEYGRAEPKIAIHEGDAEIYRNLVAQGQMFGMHYTKPIEPNWWIEHEEKIPVAHDLDLKVIHIPGHSPGSCAFELKKARSQNETETWLFSGDTLFYRSVGRTDLWGANPREMENSIRNRLYKNYDDAVVFPGHGPKTYLAQEREKNPFVRL